ncbi:receptor-like protein kinase [Striga asiatica]|uniref:non-specific serine/threonine protein kinase n=1 Tax=Striga asiatica TaxID=4170 RepID=A0A5A7RCB8_STRAF|nr:receptor-like protein kinase [Striga asiatica]
MELFLARRASRSANLAKRLIFASVCAVLLCTSASQLLPADEVQILQTISSRLNNTHWNLSRNSCNEPTAFNTTYWRRVVESIVVCDCSFNNGSVCHVTNIQLRGFNLTGPLPEAFVNLTHLVEIDLTRNYINGSIPAIFGQLRLTSLSLLGNRLSGPIPAEIGNIATLESLVLEDNLLEGNLPASLGNLRNLNRLLLSANHFNGTIPSTFVNLRNLTDFRIDGSTLSGRIPEFIGNWTRLTRLDLQGTSMEGPIPARISELRFLLEFWNSRIMFSVNTFMVNRRISDLRGRSMSFPNLQEMASLERLMLKNCSIVGSIPPYLGSMVNLSTLDLSFNMLDGTIPVTLQNLPRLRFMFLSHNSITGEVPGWILSSSHNFDLSYNNFTHSRPVGCQFSTIIEWCLRRDLPCPTRANRHSFFVNCGGGRTRFEDNEYDENLSNLGPSHFEWNDRWAYSSTGTYMGEENAPYRVGNDSLMIDANTDLYQTARLAPSSIKYYGLCLRQGSYRVRLYFAEIMYFDNATYSNLGRRVFDVAIQGRVVLPDFDIARAANGVRRGIYREFDVDVNGSTLEIHLYWTGQGTTAIPIRGIYGPLISAIAVTPSEWCFYGVLSDGTVIAVKQLSSKSKQGNREFVNEIGMISALQHPNLVKLFGCCIEGNQLLLIYEYLENNCLARALFGREEQRLNLNWSTRKKICIGIAKGLAYLHEESRLKIVHRDIKATNVLLDRDLIAKISDFGLAKLDEEENTHISTRIAGTIGYMAPEYAMRGYLTDKADVYSYGIVLLEIVSGKSNTNYRPKEEFVYLLDWAYVLQEQGNLLDLVDPTLGLDFSKEEALKMLNLSLLCANPSPTLRPTMSSVVSMLEGKAKVQAPLVKRGPAGEDVRFKAFEVLSQDSQTRVSKISQDSSREQRGVSMDGPWVDSSVSLGSKDESGDHKSDRRLLPDLYDVNMD